MIGKQIGSYRITEKLGEGGMGVVYKAEDVSLGRPVAIKALSSDFAQNPELVERFRSEARAQANLNHTNLATLYAFLVEDGSAYMVMEFVEGETFAQMIQRRGPIPAHDAIPLFKQALLGIGYAHRSGIVHRDIKPSNIMVNRAGIVKVMDFGIAKVMGTRGLTRTGMQMGTVAYMSPEQIQNRPVDIRSDIYALGITLYEMLSGRVPFESDSDFQVMQDTVRTPPPLPSQFYPYIDKPIEKVVLKSIEKDPHARYQTVEEFGHFLEHPELLEYAPAAAVLPAVGAQYIAPGSGGPARATVLETPGTAPSTVGAPLAAPASAVPAAVGASFFTQQRKLIIGGAGAILVLLAAFFIYSAMTKTPTPVASAGGGGASPSGGPVAPSGSGGGAVLPSGVLPGGSAPPGAAGAQPNTGGSQPPGAGGAQPKGGTPAKSGGGKPAKPGGKPSGGAAKPPAGGAPAASGTQPPPGGAPGTTSANTPDNTPAQPPAPSVVIPTGTTITIRMIDSVDSASAKPGQIFHASVDAPVADGDRVIIPKGSDARVRIVNAKSAGKMTGRSELQIELVSLTIRGENYPVRTELFEQQGKSQGKDTAKKVGIGAAIGAGVGAIIAHGKGALIGAGIGGGAGAGAKLLTHGEQVKIPSETKLDFKLSKPLSVAPKA